MSCEVNTAFPDIFASDFVERRLKLARNGLEIHFMATVEYSEIQMAAAYQLVEENLIFQHTGYKMSRLFGL